MAEVARIPRERSPDSTLALLADGYLFVSRRCRRYQTDVFATRLMLRRAVCVLGEDAARMFYEPGRFTRQGATPITALRLLQDEGCVALLDGEAHRWRKQMFMSLMTPSGIQGLVAAASARWRAAIRKWAGMGEVVLHDGVQELLCRAVCAWAGVPLAEAEARRRTRELGAMIEGAGAVGPRALRGLLLRRRTERWLRDVINRVRAGTIDAPEGSAARVIAWHREPDGARSIRGWRRWSCSTCCARRWPAPCT
jgi:fatty-acid peroxygenase